MGTWWVYLSTHPPYFLYCPRSLGPSRKSGEGDYASSTKELKKNNYVVPFLQPERRTLALVSELERHRGSSQVSSLIFTSLPVSQTPVVDTFRFYQFDFRISIACSFAREFRLPRYILLMELSLFCLSSFDSNVSLSTLDAFVTSSYPRLAKW